MVERPKHVQTPVTFSLRFDSIILGSADTIYMFSFDCKGDQEMATSGGADSYKSRPATNIGFIGKSIAPDPARYRYPIAKL